MARRVHDTHVLGEQFSALAEASTDITGDRRTLVGRVPTRWNSEHDWIDSHVALKPIVESIIGNTANKLGAFKLSDDQWSLAHELSEVLSVSDSFSYS